MIASYSLTDKMAEMSLGSFVSGYSPERRNRIALTSVPLALFVCSGFFAMSPPTSGSERPATEALVMTFSQIGTVETKPPAALADATEVAPEPFPTEQPPPDPVQQVQVTPAIVEPVVPETVMVSQVIEHPVEPLVPVPAPQVAEAETITDTAPQAETVAEPVAVPRPPKKPVQEPQLAETPAAEPTPVAAQALENEPVKAEAVESEPAATQVAALHETQPQGHRTRAETASEPSEPIVVFDPDFLVPPDPPVYPPMSLKRHEQGTVVVRALVSGAGAAREVRIWQSSGFRRLDRAAQVAVQDWQFAPAVRLGLPVAAWVEVPVHFQLN